MPKRQEEEPDSVRKMDGETEATGLVHVTPADCIPKMQDTTRHQVRHRNMSSESAASLPQISSHFLF